MLNVNTKSFPAPPLDRKEILRYMGAREESAELLRLVEDCISDAEGKLSYKTCYLYLPLNITGDVVNFEFTSVRSAGLAKHLSGCRGAIAFAATVGIGIDRMIAKAAVSSQLAELAFSAIGAERIEALCEAFCSWQKIELAKERGGIKSRFSPGYSDLPLEFQREIFSLLGCAEHIGLTLNESLLMTPTKSVTAIIGVYDM